MNGWPKTPEAALAAMRVWPNPFLDIHRPPHLQILWSETPTERAVRSILATHCARLWPLPPAPDISPWIELLQLEADIAAAVHDIDPDEVTRAGIRALAAR